MAYTDIDKPSDYFNTLLYTANNTGGTSITGVGFQPDLIWFKNRTSAYGHRLCDSIRGANKLLSSNASSAEATPTDSVRSIDSDGFTLGVDNEGYGVNYPNGNNIASWNWLASNTTASNTDGSITSTVSANTTSGFSIVSYTGNGTGGATVGHGLSSTPHMYIVKRRDVGSSNWHVYHQGIGATKGLRLNLDNAENTTDIWQDTAPTSSVFSLGSSIDVNASGGSYIAYCFAEKQGFSKFGSYTGNGSTDGTFVYTGGMKPAFLIVKKTDSVNSWVMFDNKRSSSGGSNEIDFSLTANSSDAEETGTTSSDVDFCANGVKIREDNGGVNASGGSYIYMTFAENPFVTSTGVPATAR